MRRTTLPYRDVFKTRASLPYRDVFKTRVSLPYRDVFKTRASLPYRGVFQTCIACPGLACLTVMSFRLRLFGQFGGLFRKFVELYGLLYVDLFNNNINIYLLVGHLL